MTTENSAAENGIQLENSIIRFPGDSGDGIQTTGAMFSHDSALLGHDVSSMPDFPAEIRAPAGTLAGVSSFQLNFSSYDIHTPGDRPDVLVALNPAALKVHLEDLVSGGTIIFNEDAFTAQDLKKFCRKSSESLTNSIPQAQLSCGAKYVKLLPSRQ